MDLYNYFSSNAKLALYRASLICQDYRHPEVEPEHLLLSILRLDPARSIQETPGVAFSPDAEQASRSALFFLQTTQVDLPTLTQQVEQYLAAQGRTMPEVDNPPFGARTLALLDSAYRQVQRAEGTEISTIHLLWALVSEAGSPLRDVFAVHGMDPAAPDPTEPAGASVAPEPDAVPAAAGQPPADAAPPQTGEEPMELYNYFSFSAKKAIYRASEVCQNFNNPFVDPEHVFFSILQLRSCSAVQVLSRLNVNLPKLMYGLEASLYERSGTYKGSPQFSARTLALLDTSFREVKKLGHREIGTTHLLIALAQERGPVLRQMLEENRLDAKKLRDAFTQHLRGYGVSPTAEEAEPDLPGWPRGVDEPLEIGGVTFTPGKSLSAVALSLLGGAAQLASVLRQPEITPAELLASLLIAAARPPTDPASLMGQLDGLDLLNTLLPYWQNRALPVDQRVKQPPLSAALSELLGRAFAQMLKSMQGAGEDAAQAPKAVIARHLVLALLDEPSEPVHGWLDAQPAVPLWQAAEAQRQAAVEAARAAQVQSQAAADELFLCTAQDELEQEAGIDMPEPFAEPAQDEPAEAVSEVPPAAVAENPAGEDEPAGEDSSPATPTDQPA